MKKEKRHPVSRLLVLAYFAVVVVGTGFAVAILLTRSEVRGFVGFHGMVWLLLPAVLGIAVLALPLLGLAIYLDRWPRDGKGL